MRLGTGAAALLAAVGALSLGVAAPAQAADRLGARQAATWTSDLAAGETAGVVVEQGRAKLDAARSLVTRGTGASLVPVGMLTLAPQRLPAATGSVRATVVGRVPVGTTAGVDVRGRRASGGWTEWVPASPAPGGAVAALPEPATEVQGRLVLTGMPGTSPEVRDVRMTAAPTAAATRARSGAVPLRSRVFATREGLVGRTTANGHVITERDRFVALPSRRALSPRGTSDYSVKVCTAGGRCAFAPVWDVGPWNTRDDYWNPSAKRQMWNDLPQGLPEAQAARERGYNGGKDQYGRRIANPAGIDLADGLFWDALGLKDNSWVNVDYLWTSTTRLAAVSGTQQVLAAPEPGAASVGVAVDRAAVPVECATGTGAGRWLRLGTGQYLPAAVVPTAGAVAACPAG